jgi:hypothetical protein
MIVINSEIMLEICKLVEQNDSQIGQKIPIVGMFYPIERN